MGRATVFDAFQAVTGATQTVLGTLDKEYKAQAAIELQNAQLQNAEAFDSFLLDMQNSGDWENYEKNWESFKAKAYNAGAQNLSSPYARKLYDSQYKEAEMRQRLTVRHAADQKRRLETVTNGYALVNRMAQSNTYADKEVTLEDGSVYTKTAGEQKMEDIQKTLLTMYDGGLIDYAQLNQHMKEAAANVMLTDMVKAGQAAVDNMGSLEEVLDTVGNYKGSYTSVAGDTVSQDMVMDKAKGAAASYFKEKQALRYQESEQGASKIYAELLPALRGGDMDAAEEIAKRGLAYIQAQDEKYKGDGFSAALRDEYVQKFSIFDNIRKLGKHGALAQMNKNDIVDYLQFLMKNGITITDEDGKQRVEHFSAKQLLDHIRHDVMPKMIEAQPEREPLIQATWGGALLRFVDTLLSSEYAPPGVADYVNDLDKTVENILQEKEGYHWAQTPKGKNEITYMQSLVKAQILSHAAEWTVKDGHFNVDGLKEVVDNAVDSVYTAEIKKNSDDKAVVQTAQAQAATRDLGPWGEDIETDKSKEQKLRLVNVAADRTAKSENISVNEAGEKYNKIVRDDGSILLTDKDGTPRYLATITTDKKGKEIYDALPVEKDASGNLRAVKPEKTSKEIAKDTEEFKRKARSIQLYNSTEGNYGSVRFKDQFLNKIEKLPSENQDIFLEAIKELEAEIKKNQSQVLKKRFGNCMRKNYRKGKDNYGRYIGTGSIYT